MVKEKRQRGERRERRDEDQNGYNKSALHKICIKMTKYVIMSRTKLIGNNHLQKCIHMCTLNWTLFRC